MGFDVYVLAAVSINGTLIKGIQEQNVNSGLNVITIGSDGDVDASFSAIIEANPNLGFKTTAIATFLGVCGISGLAISGDGVELFYQLTTPSGVRAGTYKSISIAAGMVIPRSVSARQGDSAKLSFDIVPLSSDGSASPFTYGTDAPEGSGTAELFTLGPVKPNGTLSEGTQSLDFEFGLKEKRMRHSGVPFPMRVHIESRQPAFKIKSTDISGFFADTSWYPGLAASGSSLLFLRKVASNGTRVANATTQHIKFTVTNGIWTIMDQGGTYPGEQTASIEIKPIIDGTNAVVQVSTASAIS